MLKEIYLAGGCFWGVEKAFQSLKGITNTTVGYLNGKIENPTYELVKKGNSEFKEAVKIVYDESVIPLNIILKAFFICIDPSQSDGQKGDLGSQYLTGVYYVDENDFKEINDYFNKEKKKYKEFYTELKPLENFYEAEEYHQNYLIKNPHGYCHIQKEEYEKIKNLNQEY